VEGRHALHSAIQEQAMVDFLIRTKQLLWLFVQIGFLAILSITLVHLILGPNSGTFVTSVADNLLKFANEIPAQSLVGLAIVLALVLLIGYRMK
jgi:hypothetical protein